MSEAELTDQVSPYVELDNLNIPELARELKSLQIDVDQRKAATATIQAKIDHLRHIRIPNMMEDLGVTSMNITGLGRVTATPDIWTKTADPIAMMKWLRKVGLEDLIKDSVNASTMKAEIKRRMKAAENMPPDDIFKITPFKRASVTLK